MTDKSVEQQIAEEYYHFTIKQGWRLAGMELAIHQASGDFAKGFLSIERNGIPLRRVVELWDRLVVLDEDQKLPEPVYLAREYLDPAWVEEAVKSDMLRAGFKRVTEIRGE